MNNHEREDAANERVLALVGIADSIYKLNGRLPITRHANWVRVAGYAGTAALVWIAVMVGTAL